MAIDRTLPDRLPDQYSYRVEMQVRSPFMVGYHVELDELFLFYTDQNDLTWVFREGRLDAIGFWEFFNFNKAIILGEL
ncbi:MAG TPA: hypothetical protein PL000_19420 [Anaerolineales bacterium]|nr:hypothetical protein [Anaerolineales bacterium]